MNNSKWVKTRKEHWCHGCCRKFPVGSRLNYCSGLFDGEFYSCYYCKVCDDYINEHRKDFEDGIAEGDVKEVMNE